MGVTVEQTVYELLPVGEYRVSISEIEEETGQFGEQLAFLFELQDGDHAGSTLRGWCSKKFSNKSKLYGWTKAAFGGVDIPLDYAFNSDDILGRHVMVTVIVKSKDDGTEFNKIEGFRPYDETPEPKRNAPVPPPPFEEEEIPF